MCRRIQKSMFVTVYIHTYIRCHEIGRWRLSGPDFGTLAKVWWTLGVQNRFQNSRWSISGPDFGTTVKVQWTLGVQNRFQNSREPISGSDFGTTVKVQWTLGVQNRRRVQSWVRFRMPLYSICLGCPHFSFLVWTRVVGVGAGMNVPRHLVKTVPNWVTLFIPRILVQLAHHTIGYHLPESNCVCSLLPEPPAPVFAKISDGFLEPSTQ